MRKSPNLHSVLKNRGRKAAVLYIGVLGVIIAVFFTPMARNKFLASQNQFPEKFIIETTENGFQPNLIEIKAGDSVIFFNKDKSEHWPASDPHPTHEILSAFDALRPLGNGSSFEFKFSKAGEWKYHDHLSSHNKGVVIVRPNLSRKTDLSILSSSKLNFFSDSHLSDDLFFRQLKIIFDDFKKNFLTDFNSAEINPLEIEKLLKEKDSRKQAVIVRQMAEKYGPRRALEFMEKSGLPFTGETHLLVHEIGNVAYEKYKKNALLYCNESFLSACYHGVILNELAENGLLGVADMIKQCKNSGIHVFTQCSHAAGHGFLAWTDYKILKALSLCDELGEKYSDIPLFNCYDGVFMENIFGVHDGKPSPNRLIKKDDPYYPCDSMPEKYKAGCFADQATLMFQLFSGNLRKVAEHCDKVTNTQYKTICYNNFARQIHPMTEGKTEKAVDLCKNASDGWQETCLITLVNAAFSVGDRNKMPYEICAYIKDPAKNNLCYESLFSNFVSYAGDKKELTEFCGRILENKKKEICFKKFQISIGKNESILSLEEEIEKIKKMAEEFGAAKAYSYLKDNWRDNPLRVHDLAHLIGHLAYKQNKEKAFSICDNSFAFGCFHGLLEDLIDEEGNAGIGLAQNSCGKLWPQGRIASCIHGIGHGIFVWQNKNIGLSLKTCETLNESERQYCFDGVFMEYFSGVMEKLENQKSAIDTEEKWSACLNQDKQYQRQCVRNLIFFLAYSGQDITKSIIPKCKNLDKDLNNECINSIGLFAAQRADGSIDSVKETCASLSGDDRFFCLIYSAKEFTFQGKPKDFTSGLCDGLNDFWHGKCTDEIKKTINLYN